MMCSLSFLRTAAARYSSKRCLASSRRTPFYRPPRCTTDRTDLLNFIRKKCAEEESEGRTEMDEELTELRRTAKRNAWRVMAGGYFTRMHRNNNNMRIRLSFHGCKDVITESQYEEHQDDYGEPSRGSIRFMVTATPKKTGKTLIFQCTSKCHGTASIDAVSVSTDESEIDKIHTSEYKYNEYSGMDFNKLKEAVKDHFMRLLQVDVGIDTDTACFINAYAKYKGQESYVRFLKDVDSILK